MSYITNLIAHTRAIMEFSEDAQVIGELVRELEKAQPRIITTLEELDALTFESVVADAYGTPYVCEKHRLDNTGNEWVMAGTNYLQASQFILEHGDVTVHYTPEETK